MPMRDNTCHKLTFCDEQASVQPANLASAKPCLSTFRPRITPVEVGWLNTCHKRIEGKVSHVKFGDPEQFQGFCVRGNETSVAIHDGDGVRGTRHQVVQSILTSPIRSLYSSRFEGDASSRAADRVLGILKLHSPVP